MLIIFVAPGRLWWIPDQGQDDDPLEGGGINLRIAHENNMGWVEAPRRGAIRPGRAADGALQGRLQLSEERHHEGLGGGQGGDGEYRATRAPLDQSACGLVAHYRARRYGFAGQGR